MAARVRAMREAPAHILGPRIILLLTVLALTLLGFVMIYSTSSVIALVEAPSPDAVNPMADTINQIKLAVVGVVLAIVIWKILPCWLWKSNAVWVVWAVAFLLLIATAIAGTGDEEWGARRWLYFGGTSLQASEFAKIALVLVAARLFTDFRAGAYSVGVFFALLFFFILMPVGMILFLQSDLGTAMICVVGIFAVMWLGEVPGKTMLIVAGLVFAFGLYGVFGEEYRMARFMVFLNPWDDGQDGYGNGYQIIHSLFALSGGGLFGVGLGNSHEKYLYLTQSESDFIFAIIGEELGLVGAFAVVILFVLFLYAGLRIARSSSDGFGAMMAGGLTLMIVFQAFLNMAMVMGWFPVVGKPLPFISSGGSSLVATFIMVGLILSVSRGAQEPTVYDRRRADLRVVRAVPSDGGARPSERSSRLQSSRSNRR